MAFFGKKSGFANLREAILFGAGLLLLGFHILTVQPDDYNWGVFAVAGGLLGLPYFIGKDEK